MRVITADLRRAKDLIRDSNNRYRFVQETKFDESFANYLAENCYDVLRELIEAKLSKDGFKTNSHKETIKYLKILKFSEHEHFFLDELRRNRNKIKYEGKSIDYEYALKTKEFTVKLRKKLLELFQKSNKLL